MGKNEHILEQNMLAKMESLKVVSNMVILNHNYVTIGRMASICPHSLHGHLDTETNLTLVSSKYIIFLSLALVSWYLETSLGLVVSQ